MCDSKSPISSLLTYSGEYLGMSYDERFDNVRTLEDAKAHPLLKDVGMDRFFLEPLKDMYDIPDFEFYNFGEPSYRNIPKRSIVGTAHDAYSGMSWLTALTCLQRACCKSDEEIVSDLSMECQIGGWIELAKFGDEYYITNGNSRIIQAQFAPSISVIPCMVTEYVFDERRFGIATAIEASGAVLERPGSHRIGYDVTVRYDDTPIRISFDELGLEVLESAIGQLSRKAAGRRGFRLWCASFRSLLVSTKRSPRQRPVTGQGENQSTLFRYD